MAVSGGATEVRHQFSDRVFHWVMAACILVLGATAFLPIIGIKFDWLPIHWWTGVILVAAILFHFYRVFAVHGISKMLPMADDVKETVRVALNRSGNGLKPAKYDAFQKSYHWTAAITVLATAVTGLVMLAKIDTTFWKRDPSLLSEPVWGVIYVIHGLGAMLLLFLVILHIYFSLIPSHRGYLVSMILGHGPGLARKD
ncbi:MAG: cytochrome b/b6 domain-containing protein [Paracoccaceae bacterium]|nr:cytochrome b/b6 domain-containing protein [Paracoccaceae bacterium]MDE2914291.1 cytochrome b/b6 domain-containing protein [Paracoccaceae bacterium]